MTAVIPDGLEPLATWDARTPEWLDEHFMERITWASEHIPERDVVYRLEFYVFDSPFAVAHRYKRHAAGRAYHDPDLDGPARDEPVIVPLTELPPPHLLRPSAP